jgi:hypothetical protein
VGADLAGRRHDAQLHPGTDGARQPHDAHEHRRRRHLPRRVANGALCSIQTSFVTIGNYPHRSASIREHGRAHLPAGREKAVGNAARRHARSGGVRELEIPARCYPPGGTRTESWRTLFWRQPGEQLHTEILDDGPANEGDFGDGAWVQEVINAVELSFRERRWIALPLPL